MLRKILCLILAISLISVTGCALVSKAQDTSTTTPASVSAVREAKIGKTWLMKQMEIDLDNEASIQLTLKDGDSVGFNISGSSPIYTSKSTDTETLRITSDRFSFTASQAQGIAYTLTFNGGSNVKTGTTVFIEIIYPVTGLLYVPFGTK
jgi:hypothetical protein